MPPKEIKSYSSQPRAARQGFSQKRLRRSARHAPLLGEIKSTSDLSSDDLIDQVNINAKSLDSKWPKVIIPIRDIHEAVNHSLTSSAGISLADDSSIGTDETPLTSAAATPFEPRTTKSSCKKPFVESKTTIRRETLNSRTRLSAQSFKRAVSKFALSDEQLARQLHEADFQGDDTMISEQSKRSRRGGLIDSEDETSDDQHEISNPRRPRKRGMIDRKAGAVKKQRTQQPKVDTAELASRLPIRHARVKAARSLQLPKVTKSDESDPDNVQGSSASESDASFGKLADNSDSSALSEPPDESGTSGNEAPMLSKKSPHNKTRKDKQKSTSRPRHQKMICRVVGESRAEYERRRLDTAHPKLKSLWEDLAKVPVVKPIQASQPAGINRTLKSFQLEGVDWMRRMETDGQWKGGLLGDEMGMGKTIQAVSLIMSDYPANRPTLVVVPPVALMQWSAEIKAYTDGKLKVLIHHNTDPKVKTFKVKDLLQYDVIMISYSGLESIHRKEVKGWKRDDGLVKENSRIHAIHYHRLILDEAHSIKTRTTQVAKACFALKADFKWCLSGTPVQNRIGEFFSLLRFLEVEPFANYFCKECSCESLHWSQDDGGRCSKCSHTGFEHVSLFNQELLNPITSGDVDDRTQAMKKLRLLTDRIMLRRMKRDHTSSMELPPKQIVIHNEFFGPEERDFSRSIMTNTTRQFDTYVARGVELNNYANIFGLIMQMRQVANHPDLILKKNAHGGQNILVCSVCDEPAEEPIRSQCHHEFCRRCAKDYVRSFAMSAKDPDCPRCHIKLRIDFDQPAIEQDEDIVKKSSIINRIKMEDWHSSSKIEMLIYELFSLRSPKRTVKSIVFSQFTSMLQLVEWRLRRAGFSTVMLDGSMGPAQRQNSIDHFMNNVGVEVFLVSLKAGGVALNLTEASRVFIVDPWWNPAAEWQSADRCHRIGQKRPCQITRLCIEDSVESRMVLLQEKKANLINGTVNGDDVALGKLTPEDLQFLFRGA